MSDSSIVTTPALPTFLRQGIPVAPFAMQKILTKAIRSHATNQNLHSTAIKGPDKVGGKRGGRAGRAGRAGKTSTVASRK
jgi:hypothetical protein